jgi:SAM-dependent methyltransferase
VHEQPTATLEQVLALLEPALEIVNGRVGSATPPVWCERRGWTDFLLGLSDAELEHAEEHGLLAEPALGSRMPDGLALWLGQLAQAVRVPALRAAAAFEPWRGVRARKRAQLAAMLQAIAPLAHGAQRIVDFGAGRGHFSRLAALAFETDVLGLERSAERVAQARESARAEQAAGAAFLRLDLMDQSFALAERDLAFGLHACGELGDRLVLLAARARARVVLVSCCAQKIAAAARPALSAAMAGITLGREVLGLSNLAARAEGVETTLRRSLQAREARHGLLLLLRERGLALAPGEELYGLNRRRAHGDFAELARSALAARGLHEPSAAELRHAERTGRAEFGCMRRLSLPRNALARLLELAVVLDRARALEAAGLAVVVAEVFEPAVSPRNLGLFASRDAAELPQLPALAPASVG